MIIDPQIETDTAAAPRRTWLRRGLRIALPLFVVLLGVGTALTLIQTAPRPQRVAPERARPRVTTRVLERESAHPRIEAMGTVRPAQEVALRPRVGGRVVELADELVPGGHLAEGALAVAIDAADYELAVRQAETALAEAEALLQIEEGRQVVARRELELLGVELEEGEEALALRAPQRASAVAQVQRAEATLAQARLNLARTEVTAPFDAVVQERSVGVGAEVSSATTLATLVATDHFWVELLVPVDALRWLELPAPGAAGAPAMIYQEAAWGAETFREGRVFRLESDVDQVGRMARLLVVVEDPLALRREHAELPPLLGGSYVRVELAGRELEGVFAIEREHLHPGDELWLVGEGDRLERRHVEVLYRGRDTVLLETGLAEGERLVTSEIGTPVEGMQLAPVNETDASEARPRRRERS